MRRTILPGIVALAFVCLFTSSTWAVPPAPVLGVDGDIVNLPRDSVVPSPPDSPNRGFRITKVRAKTPAAAMGLEPGDILISVDSIRFNSMKGLKHALVCAGQRPSFLIINVRNGNFIRRSVALPHREPEPEDSMPQPPDSYGMSIDLESDFRPESDARR